ncbi:MAG: Dinucleotide-utilizing protein [Parcubacteria group bacterium GW2011_GWA2_42_18]|nr:MAG: Dinucleotide-utilizing protein [Parcubacteria group bacterium GW2011_GWA2_42_18]
MGEEIKKKKIEHMKPIILSEDGLENFKKTNKIWRVCDVYGSQRAELAKIKSGVGDEPPGHWIYYPWSGELIHILAENDYFFLRTNRNRNLITEAEQKKLYDFPVAMVGLSVGNSIALSLAYGGFSGTMKLSDRDNLETGNLNRIRAGVSNVNIPKVELTARQIYEINPYADLHLFSDGLNNGNVAGFVAGDPKPKLIFEEIDDFKMKIKIRLTARGVGVPVIMLTNLGDSILVDVERYDLDKNTKVFNGKVEEKIINEILNGSIGLEEEKKYAVQIVGRENLSQRIIESLPEIGKTLAGRPQLGGTVAACGGLAAYLARKIALGELLPSGRKLLRFDLW